ncbi:MAG: DUF4252 domain-containing protein [Cyclobacteriaceae bacterium]|nr:DUF4252 domain-containing protein [Cyclobacteriaceae bacterium]
MKKIAIVSILILSMLAANAQEDAITKFFSKYQNDESFTQINITGRMFSLFTNFDAEDKEDQDVIDAISKVKGLKILAKEDISNGQALYDEAFRLIDSNEYEELMTIREKDNDMKFLIKEEDGIIAELLMVMGSNDSFFLLSLVGDIDLKQISKLSKSMDIDGFEKLQNLDK